MLVGLAMAGNYFLLVLDLRKPNTVIDTRGLQVKHSLHHLCHGQY